MRLSRSQSWMVENEISAFLFQGGGAGGGLNPLFLMLPLLAVFYFFMILSQQREQKPGQPMISQLKTGERVATQRGIRGSIVGVEGDDMDLRVDPHQPRLGNAQTAGF